MPLVEDEEQFEFLAAHLKQACDSGAEKHVEIRSADRGIGGLAESACFCLHRIDLRPSLSELFHAFHESCIRRKIRQAERAGLTYEEGVSVELLRKFYQLTLLTRRRHQVPPQPFFWFRNLMACLGPKAKIRLASYEGRPAAGILTVQHKSIMTYKYGGSDSQFHKYGPVQLLIWKAIQEAKQGGMLWFDMGRTDLDNQGLLTFKDHWGGTRSPLTYLRYPRYETQPSFDTARRVAKVFFASAPTRLLTAAGSLLYPHID